MYNKAKLQTIMSDKISKLRVQIMKIIVAVVVAFSPFQSLSSSNISYMSAADGGGAAPGERSFY